jgi:hypothetical protein
METHLLRKHLPANLDVVVEAAGSVGSNEAQHAALDLLFRLALAPETQDALFYAPHLVDVAIRAAGSGATNEIRHASLGLLEGLSFDGMYAIKLFARPGLVDAALSAAASGATDEIRTSGFALLQARAPKNRVALFSTPGLVAAAVKGLAKGATGNMRLAGLGLLAVLAFDDGLARRLVNHTGLLVAVLKCTPLRVAAFTLLHALSRERETAQRRLDTAKTVRALSAGLQHADEEVRLLATMALANILGKDPKRSTILAAFLPSLVSALKASLLGDDTERTRDVLQAIDSLCFVEAHAASFFAAWLAPLLVRAIGSAIDADDPRAAEYAIGSLRKLAVSDAALGVLCVDAELSTLLGDVAALIDARWDAGKSGARDLGLYVIGDTPPFRAAPDTPDDIKAWLDEAGMAGLYADLAREGFVSGKTVALLAEKGAADISVLLKVKGSDALNLEAAFKKRGRWGGWDYDTLSTRAGP